MSIKVAFQGERGAFSEKAARDLLGDFVETVQCPTFEDAFLSVSKMIADYAVVPIENSTGGSVYANVDNLLRFNLHIIAEHECRIKHALLVLPGTNLHDIRHVMSHPQALAQCDKYLRSWPGGIHAVAAENTATAAKTIKDKNLTSYAAIASADVAPIYGLEVIDNNIEDDATNTTRFLLLGRHCLTADELCDVIPKTSVVIASHFIHDTGGGIEKFVVNAMSCLSALNLRCCKFESRPIPIQLREYLHLKMATCNSGVETDDDKFSLSSWDEKPTSYVTERRPLMNQSPCIYYLDILDSELNGLTDKAITKLREVCQFVRVLGLYAQGGKLCGRISNELSGVSVSMSPVVRHVAEISNGSVVDSKPLKIAIIGFGNFGQFLGKTFVKYHNVYGINKDDVDARQRALEMGCNYFSLDDVDLFVDIDFDVVILSMSIISFEHVLKRLPARFFSNKLVVDVLSVKSHAKAVLLAHLPIEADILCTHPMFGPESGKFGWRGLRLVFEKVRLANVTTCARYMGIWEKEGCELIEMSCEMHDKLAADSQLITHLTARMLLNLNLTATPIDTKGFQTLRSLVATTGSDSFDLFFGLHHYNPNASDLFARFRDALSSVETKIAVKALDVTVECIRDESA